MSTSRHTARQRDDICTFMPTICAEEYARRAKLRSLRNVAAAMISETESSTARQLAWLASDYITQSIYAPAAAEALDDLIKLCDRLMRTAMHAQRVDLFGAGQ